jgi:hypothetical protein
MAEKLGRSYGPRIRRWVRRLNLVALLSLPLVLGQGCSQSISDLLSGNGLQGLLSGGNSDSGSVDLSPPQAAAPALPPAPASPGTVVTQATPPLPLPDGGTPPVAPAAITPPDLSAITSKEPISALQARGIRITGSPDDQALKNTLIAAHQLDPQDTQELTVNFTGGKRTSGTLGVWTTRGQGGLVTIFAMDRPTAILHEICHHATLYPKSQHGASVANEVFGELAQKYGNDLNNWPDSVCTCSYARKNSREWRAEFFSVMRVMDLKLPWDYLAENATAGTFNPPQDLRARANNFYAPGNQGT